jgi:predicted ATPase
MRARLEELLALAAEHGISAMKGAAIFLLNFDAQSEKVEIAELVEVLRATATASWQRVFCLCALAERCREKNLIEEGLALLASISAEDRVAIYAPEILRLEGELRRSVPSASTEEIERCFESALALARQRKEKSLELRAAMSLARFWCDHGRRAAACELLKPVYDWFTEGFDLPDLRNAAALLRQ